jgi:hypothetical protein
MSALAAMTSPFLYELPGGFSPTEDYANLGPLGSIIRSKASYVEDRIIEPILSTRTYSQFEDLRTRLFNHYILLHTYDG